MARRPAPERLGPARPLRPELQSDTSFARITRWATEPFAPTAPLRTPARRRHPPYQKTDKFQVRASRLSRRRMAKLTHLTVIRRMSGGESGEEIAARGRAGFRSGRLAGPSWRPLRGSLLFGSASPLQRFRRVRGARLRSDLLRQPRATRFSIPLLERPIGNLSFDK
jgi:hypothetical protein